MDMKISPAPLALLLVAAAVAAGSAQEFAGRDESPELYAGFRGAALRQKLIPQAPPMHAMGDSGRDEADELVRGIPNVSAYQARGIDISHFQHKIDWSGVKTDGLSFIYMKATEGADGLDDQFAANWAGAKGTGLPLGAYHFYNFCKNGADQAANFIKTVPADAGSLPPTIDLEKSADCKNLPAKAAFRKDLADFVAKVSAAYGREPILYLTYSVYDAYFKGESDAYNLWIADVRDVAPEMSDDKDWTMWQYSWHGKVAGIEGDVDFDAFNGTPEGLAFLSRPGSGEQLAVAR